MTPKKYAASINIETIEMKRNQILTQGLRLLYSVPEKAIPYSKNVNKIPLRRKLFKQKNKNVCLLHISYLARAYLISNINTILEELTAQFN
jgi:hypothetical protein